MVDGQGSEKLLAINDCDTRAADCAIDLNYSKGTITYYKTLCRCFDTIPRISHHMITNLLPFKMFFFFTVLCPNIKTGRRLALNSVYSDKSRFTLEADGYHTPCAASANKFYFTQVILTITIYVMVWYVISYVASSLIVLCIILTVERYVDDITWLFSLPIMSHYFLTL